MKHCKRSSALAIATTVLAVVGCGGGGGSTGDGGTAVTPPPPIASPPMPSPSGTDFTVFTRDLLLPAKTNDSDEPVELESIEFVFTDDENEAAYDDIVASSES